MENTLQTSYRWISKVEVFQNNDPFALQADLNKFCDGRFVVGTQLFPDPKTKLWTAFVWFKIRA